MPFREGSQRLYEQTQAGGRGGVEEVRVAFNRPKSVERWYSSTDTGTIRGIDESKPTWKLDGIRGRIENAGIVLSQGETLVESFSTGRHQGHAYLQFDYTHPTFIEDSWTVDLMMTEAFEGGVHIQRETSEADHTWKTYGRNLEHLGRARGRKIMETRRAHRDAP